MFASRQTAQPHNASNSTSIHMPDLRSPVQSVLDNRYPPRSLARAQSLPEPASAQTTLPMIQRKCACGGTCSCQHKDASKRLPDIPVSQPGDALEQEADNTANRLLSLIGGGGRNKGQQDAATSKDEFGVPEEENLTDEVTGNPPAKAASGGRTVSGAAQSATPGALRPLPGAVGAFEQSLAAQYGPGQPLPGEISSAAGTSLGYDLSTVRIYPQEGQELAARFDARAFTVGRHIYFDKGEYNPDSSEGRRILLHELAHTTQANRAGEMIQRVPHVSTWDFHNTGNSATDNCCSSCPIALGVNSHAFGAGSFTNGMELQAFIADDETGTTYDMKRVKERSTWNKVGGAWTNTSHVGPGANDDSTDTDECLTPIIKVPYLPYIYSVDAPGFNTAPSNASATEAVYKATFTESVDITPSGGTTIHDATVFNWHTINWLTNTGGTWAFDTTRSEIAAGSVTVGTTAP